nr:MAG TPA: hypothetical protein [Caudoviricetes sp.]
MIYMVRETKSLIKDKLIPRRIISNILCNA